MKRGRADDLSYSRSESGDDGCIDYLVIYFDS